MKELMHCSYVVATLSDYGNRIITIEDQDQMPVGIPHSNNVALMQRYFDTWFSERSIPHDRQNRAQLTNAFGSLDAAMAKSMALSLTDCYWIRGASSDTRWEEVNFHDHKFSDDVARISFMDGNVDNVSFYLNPPRTLRSSGRR